MEGKARHIAERYEIDWLAKIIVENNYKRVALQLSDALLKDASLIVEALESSVPPGSASLYVLADTSYGSCCVDEVAAEHVAAEALVHFGHACLTKNSRLPVYYVFVEQEIESQVLDEMVSYFEAVLRSEHEALLSLQHVVLFASVQYQHVLELLQARLASQTGCRFRFAIAAAAKEFHPCRPEFSGDSSSFMGRALPKTVDLAKAALLYVGPESVTMTTLLMSHKNLPAWSYDPSTGAGLKQGYRVNSSLMRRYHLVEKILDAQLIGILVGTLGAQSYLQALSELEGLLRAAGKKGFVFSMGKLNVAKLANFLEIDAFVLLACPENSLFDCKEYLRPIVTPFELALSLESSSKTILDSDWTSDFVQFLRDQKVRPSYRLDPLVAGVPTPASTASEHQEDCMPRYSFATGKLVASKASQEHGSSLDAASRQPAGLIGYHDTGSASAIGRLRDRSYQGLPLAYESGAADDGPDTLSTAALEGHSGTARTYDSERSWHE